VAENRKKGESSIGVAPKVDGSSYMAAHTKKLGEVRHSEALLAGVFGVYRVDYGAHVDVRSHRRRKGLWRVQLG
jgi:hypothetical protein